MKNEKTRPLKELFEEALERNKPKTKSKKKKKRKNSPYPTGFFRVYKGYCASCKDKEMWYYRYKNIEGKRRNITSVDFLKLRKKVKDRKMEWGVQNEYYARKTAKKIGLPLRDLK